MEENEFSCRSCSAEPTDSINVRRFFEKLDACFDKNDLEGAKNVLLGTILSIGTIPLLSLFLTLF